MIANENTYDTHTLKQIGEFIRQKRKQLCYNSRGVAAAVNVTQPVISCIERGKYPGLKVETLLAILKFLNTTMAELEVHLTQD